MLAPCPHRRKMFQIHSLQTFLVQIIDEAAALADAAGEAQAPRHGRKLPCLPCILREGNPLAHKRAVHLVRQSPQSVALGVDTVQRCLGQLANAQRQQLQRIPRQIQRLQARHRTQGEREV